MNKLKKLLIANLLVMCSLSIFAKDKTWQVTVTNDTNAEVYLVKVDHTASHYGNYPVYWQTSKLSPEQSIIFKATLYPEINMDSLDLYYVTKPVQKDNMYCHLFISAPHVIYASGEVFPHKKIYLSKGDILSSCTSFKNNFIPLVSHPG